MMTQYLEELKWLATVTLILGSAVNSWGLYPLGPIVLAVGGIFWLVASCVMRDRQLTVTNSVMVVSGTVPLLIRQIWA